MKAAEKHYKFINSKTGNAISYFSIGAELAEERIKEELEKAKNDVAIRNSLFTETIYWEEVKGEE
jgi:hypothetical protein